MSYKRYNTEQIISKLDEADKMKKKGYGITQICIKLKITQSTYYSWKKKHKRTRDIENSKIIALKLENKKLKETIINLVIENASLKTQSALRS